MRLAIKIDPAAESVPVAVSKVELGFPSDLGLATSGLGLAECDPARLALLGESVCPADSRLGAGSATVGVAFGPALVHEQVTLGLFAAPSSDGFIHLSILATGLEPIDARIVMSGVLLPGRLQISVPAVPSVPGAPDVAVLSLQATLGGALTYYEHAHGHTIAYRPRGIALPDRCPPGGWRMSARVAFMDGSVSRAGTVVGCPRSTARG
ncbi:MAG TPA: hypothetical protein VHU13_04835 [Solirubrobacteraceae bacterium]|nr:hypothetical protein [Solirubrobacteraceae bacterium]